VNYNYKLWHLFLRLLGEKKNQLDPKLCKMLNILKQSLERSTGDTDPNPDHADKANRFC
jgi:hypothetical protein